MTVGKLIKELTQYPRRATVETLVDGSLIRKYAQMNHLIGIRCDLRVSGLTTFLERPIRRVVTLVIEKELEGK